MNTADERHAYLERCRQLVESIASVLAADERAWVEELIDHDEAPDGMRALAWYIADGDKRVPRAAIDAIRELSAGVVPAEQLPHDLDSHASAE